MGLRMTIPLYAAGATRSRARQAKLNAEQQKDVMVDVRNEVIAEAKSLWSQYNNALYQLKSREKEIQAIFQAREGIQTEVKLGERSLRDTLDIEQDLVDANIALIQARYEKVISVFRLLALNGEVLENYGT